MPRGRSSSPVVYEAANRELKTRQDYFAEIDKAVIGIEWAAGIGVGAEIKPGQLLAEIVWDDGSRTPIIAPSNCTGRIEWKNGQIEYDWLHKEPQLLLRLAGRKLIKPKKRRRRKRT